MGIKQKWRDESDVNLIEILDKMSEIMSPLFNNKGQVNLASFAKKNEWHIYLRFHSILSLIQMKIKLYAILMRTK
jgi:hypothetical protein